MVHWQEAFSQEHLSIAELRYGVEAGGITKVGGFENLVFKFAKGSAERILRVSHSSHRSEGQFLAELDWLTYLADQGVSVSRPLPSAEGRMLETIDSENGRFILTAFEKAEGSQVNGSHPAWGPELFRTWGYTIGLMHAKTHSYEVAPGAPQRMAVAELSIVSHHLLKPSLRDEAILRKYEEVEQEILSLPRSKESYNLCHRDLHHGNFFVHNGKITAFDFDDCAYDYFVQDIAMAVYYGTIFGMHGNPLSDINEASEIGRRFLNDFMEGYERANHLDEFWLKKLPLFIEKRRIELCLLLAEAWGPDQPKAERREWLRVNREGILEGVPCMNLFL